MRSEFYDVPIIHNKNKDAWISKFIDTLTISNKSMYQEPFSIINGKYEQVKVLRLLKFSKPFDAEITDIIDPLYQWCISSHGEWVLENSIGPPTWTRLYDVVSYLSHFYVRARFTEKKITEYYLKFS